MRHLILPILLGLLVTGCGNSSTDNMEQSAGDVTIQQDGDQPFKAVKAPSDTPTFTLAWSPYTSWSSLASAEAFGYLDNRKGHMGQFEVEHGVDVVLQRMDYVQSFGVYGAGTVDALTITNTDAFAIAHERRANSGDATVAVFPTSWSNGADKILVENEISSWADLAGVPVKGAEMSVSQYLYWRGCQENGVAEQYGKTYNFVNLDPVVGAPQFARTQSDDFRAFAGWSPETFIVLDGRGGDEDSSNDVRDLFNSAQLGRYEIVDMMIVGQKALDRPGGVEGVKALGAAMDAMTARSKDPAQQAETFRAISPNFNDLSNGMIGRAMELTVMMGPGTDLAVLDSSELKGNMQRVREFSVAHELVPPDAVTVGWGSKSEEPNAVLRFDTSIVR